MSLDNILSQLEVCPFKQIDRYTEEGKKVIGWAPMLAPQELIHAAGMVPVGIWGADGEVTLAKEYFPAFYASIVLRTMDLGLEGKLNKLSGMLITNLSDGLKGLSQNWKRAIKDVPMLYIGYGQNRKIEAGIDFNAKQYHKLVEQLEEISGNTLDNEKIEASIRLFNEHRKAMTEFNELAAKHLNTVTPTVRAKVFYSAFVYDKEEHLEIMKKINEELRNMPEEEFKGKKVVTTSILLNSEDILKIFENFNLAIVDDNVISESGQYDCLVEEGTADPVRALAELFANIEGNTFLFDEKKLRGKIITEKVKDKEADGVIYLLTKFSESEEFDFPIIRNELNEAGIKNIMIEIDQQMSNFEQARTALETFADML
ncbi:2-hydroxyacyl-CoA dehydratase family protein [Peptoniphilus sp. KCTC 25270]|uniref:2-hydroxyacyl-CoA dehydratase subunit D n=1 Tax=Peptoniphilus sp. KCTC 25270 TaxID=2897414 RepID=UPI001E4E1454|nr:2-hydroxyacyl-CoA dehydratase family protein [Peptoniphilus sp. KCTC 25270]MCD1147942.1 2-hydroxyacyl-CoA dehydratase family protein [Peptoniphilus sp. KCTC 25270]